jgi:hypothetical protein
LPNAGVEFAPHGGDFFPGGLSFLERRHQQHLVVALLAKVALKLRHQSDVVGRPHHDEV